MIAIFDEDGGGDVDFQEFVTGLSAFSARGNKEEKLQFAFKVYDIDRDGYISNGELFIVLKMMVGNNLKDVQLQQIVDKTIMEADKDQDGRISFEEFTDMVESTDVNLSMTLGRQFSSVWRRLDVWVLTLPQIKYKYISLVAFLLSLSFALVWSILSPCLLCVSSACLSSLQLGSKSRLYNRADSIMT